MPCRRHSSPVSTPASDSFRMAMICSSLNRLFLTTPPLALAGHRKRRSHNFAGLVFGGQVITRDENNARHLPREAETFSDPRQGAGVKFTDSQTLFDAARNNTV